MLPFFTSCGLFRDHFNMTIYSRKDEKDFRMIVQWLSKCLTWISSIQDHGKRTISQKLQSGVEQSETEMAFADDIEVSSLNQTPIFDEDSSFNETSVFDDSPMIIDPPISTTVFNEPTIVNETATSEDELREAPTRPVKAKPLWPSYWREKPKPKRHTSS
jgi:hypothetical protein